MSRFGQYERLLATARRLPIKDPIHADLSALAPYLSAITIDRILDPNSHASSQDKSLSDSAYTEIMLSMPPIYCVGASVTVVYSRRRNFVDVLYPLADLTNVPGMEDSQPLNYTSTSSAIAHAEQHWQHKLMTTPSNYLEFVLVDDISRFDEFTVKLDKVASFHCALTMSPATLFAILRLMNTSLVEQAVEAATSDELLGNEYCSLAALNARNSATVMHVCASCGGALARSGCLYCGKKFSIEWPADISFGRGVMRNPPVPLPSILLADKWRHPDEQVHHLIPNYDIDKINELESEAIVNFIATTHAERLNASIADTYKMADPSVRARLEIKLPLVQLTPTKPAVPPVRRLRIINQLPAAEVQVRCNSDESSS